MQDAIRDYYVSFDHKIKEISKNLRSVSYFL